MTTSISGRISNYNIYNRTAIDMQGNAFNLGDKFVKVSSNGITIQICTVTRISEEGRVYADHSKVPLMYPGRCLIIASVLPESLCGCSVKTPVQ